ncbi:DinB family protein, partial [Roseisolibacter sp. H3M3-2]|uniref:DinB family protein n=1 Tax=Roseisolibacter sp. H3M3-2 TaxID=3031323 RepID=UPI0023DBA854
AGASDAALRALAARAAAGDADGLARVVEYRTTAGDARRSTVGQILSHVALHGAYHRGQVAMLVRDGGGAPSSTDYALYVWSAADRAP